MWLDWLSCVRKDEEWLDFGRDISVLKPGSSSSPTPHHTLAMCVVQKVYSIQYYKKYQQSIAFILYIYFHYGYIYIRNAFCPHVMYVSRDQFKLTFFPFLLMEEVKFLLKTIKNSHAFTYRFFVFANRHVKHTGTWEVRKKKRRDIAMEKKKKRNIRFS